MITRQNSVCGLLLLLILVAAWGLGGCRAFQPEAVLVNKPPETYIIGAPLEDAGGYYHYHVYWYGADEDGRVERFVWALTDTTVQDPDTSDDEEDQRFNPALDATHLEIGHYTTRTDSVFNFTIDQGVATSADKTLHMVAIDDFGDFDRTPARLHFLTNTLGNPVISFYRIVGSDTIAVVPGQVDTIGIGEPFHVYWAGSTPNVRGYSPAALALLDTVAPYDDGLFGYKWQLGGYLSADCNSAVEDCWRPRRYDEASGDSISFFGNATSLLFENNDSGTSPFKRLLQSGAVEMQVNSVDVAGVEVAEYLRPFSFIVNHDPETIILDYEADWAHPADPDTYPYYIRLNDPTRTHHPFASGDRIPDRTYVVVKALARDHPDDQILNPNVKVGFSGYLSGVRQSFLGGAFTFSSEASALNREPAWDRSADGGWYGDTLGFLVQPRSEFTINMQAVDEHDRKDGTPASLSFDVGFPPCVQCVEALPRSDSPSAQPQDLPCIEDLADLATSPCFADTAEFYLNASGTGLGALQRGTPTNILVNKSTGYRLVRDLPTAEELAASWRVAATTYQMSFLLHGQDDVRERWSNPLYRAMAWRYQVSNICDPYNQIRDGGGYDNLADPSWGQRDGVTGLTVDAGSGLWRITVKVAVADNLVQTSMATFRTLLPFLSGTTGATPEDVDMIVEACVMQLGLGWIDVVALDQTQCGFEPVRPATYNLFKAVRPPVLTVPGGTWRDCFINVDSGFIKSKLPLSQATMSSLDGQPARKYFRLTLATAAGDTIRCSQ